MQTTTNVSREVESDKLNRAVERELKRVLLWGFIEIGIIEKGFIEWGFGSISVL
ncbi:MAG: hypothetical protein SGJ05_00275 [bacterium]|nr:hypothetical protein [bacterium]